MARALTPQDCHNIMNSLVKQVTGAQSITVTDTSSFVSAGELVMQAGTENVLNALSLVLGRTFMAVRPRKAKLQIINAINSGMYTNRIRKISFYTRDAQESGAFNTDQFTNFADGFDNGQNPSNGTAQSTKSMWVQNKPVVLEVNFAGTDTWQDSTTIYRNVLKQAFRDEGEFAAFVAGVMTEKGNDIERQKEAFNRMTLCSAIAQRIDMADHSAAPSSVINLTKAYNDKFGTSYTSAQLRTTYLKEFLAFFVETVKMTSDLMTDDSVDYHWAPVKVGHSLLRHTPKDLQKMILFNPLFVQAEAQVLPEIFNDKYLKLENFEAVNYWQSRQTPASLKIVPPMVDYTGNNYGLQTPGNTVEEDYVVGVIYDRDAMMVDYQLDSADSTPIEARKHYYNLWWTFAKNSIIDCTENMVVFVMRDPATNGDDEQQSEGQKG